MSGRRRVQRSVRVTIGVGLVVVAAVFVGATIARGSSTLVGVGAVVSVLLGATATRMMYAEVVQTRQEAARRRAEQARAFGDALTATYAMHGRLVEQLRSRLAALTRTIAELDGTLRLAGRRAEDAEIRAAREAVRADREEQRADESQARLNAVLNEVLAYQVAPLDPLETASCDDDLPTVVDLLAWEERTTALTSEDELRRHA